jgi:hypothetical protein
MCNLYSITTNQEASSTVGIAEIANWNKRDNVHVEGTVKDVTFGSVYLDPCELSK